MEGNDLQGVRDALKGPDCYRLPFAYGLSRDVELGRDVNWEGHE